MNQNQRALNLSFVKKIQVTDYIVGRYIIDILFETLPTNSLALL